jgi:hypothetical protein
MMGSGPGCSKLGGWKLMCGQGWEIISIVCSVMEMELRQETGDEPYQADMGSSEGLYRCYKQ